ncbi:MAG TPA: hypothetical protein VFR07_11275, partial [Mycobacteriales bacterium]|nr:hypothetical protein [Mycobacteriales bacterium]
MERPRRPAAGRPDVGPPEAGRRSAQRRSERVRAGVRRAAADGPAPAYVGLTTRAAVVGLVLCALVVSAALPLREYLSQRGQIAALEQTESTRRGEVAALQQQRALLADPTYVASLARERLH